MKYYDITRELLSAPLYPGSSRPCIKPLSEISASGSYKAGLLHADLHTGTHCDAYSHFCNGKNDIASMPLDHYIGPCCVLSIPANQLVRADYITENLPLATKRLLLKSGGTSYLAPCAAQYLIDKGIITVGTDAWSVAPMEDEASIHIPLLSNNIAIIESLDLSIVEDGQYYLVSAPIKIKGADGSPCRAILFDSVP